MFINSKNIQWRKDNKIDSILSEDFSDIEPDAPYRILGQAKDKSPGEREIYVSFWLVSVICIIVWNFFLNSCLLGSRWDGFEKTLLDTKTVPITPIYG